MGGGLGGQSQYFAGWMWGHEHRSICEVSVPYMTSQMYYFAGLSVFVCEVEQAENVNDGIFSFPEKSVAGSRRTLWFQKHSNAAPLRSEGIWECVNYALDSTLQPSQKLNGLAVSPTSQPSAKFQGNPCFFFKQLCVILLTDKWVLWRWQPNTNRDAPPFCHKSGENCTLPADCAAVSPPNGHVTQLGSPAHDIGEFGGDAALSCT